MTLAPRAKQEATFAELLAVELRRAPWFVLSMLVHAAIFALLTFVFGRPNEPEGHGLVLRANTEGQESGAVEAETAPEVAPPEPEPDAATPFQESADPVASTSESEARAALESSDTMREPAWNEQSLLTRIGGRRGTGNGRGQGDADILETARGLPSGDGFKATVAQIRKSGLEIVFVVDSTGSMGGVLQGAKRRIASMLEVLHALVPDTRIGILTYRDSGKDEDYLMRQIPLSRDHYRAAAFVQTLSAKGGGDRPEAVHEALLAALQMRWSQGAQRVIVLVGDAPPHPATEASVLTKLANFAKDGKSHIHAIVTSESGIASLPEDTKIAFTKIAKAGRGVCIGFDDEETVLRQVLSLAFGHAFRRDLDQVYRIVEEREKTVATWALDIVQRADLEALDQQLAKEPIDSELVKALVALPKLPVAQHLVDVLGKSSAPAPARHAAGFALQQMLGLSWPPLDPERGGVLGERERSRLAELVQTRLRK